MLAPMRVSFALFWACLRPGSGAGLRRGELGIAPNVPANFIRSRSRSKEPVLVDFVVFRGREGNASKDVAPRASMNIGGTDNETGFYALCKNHCPTFEEQGPGWTSPQMRFCRCVAELFVEDLRSDFGVLAANGAMALFELGDYSELSAGQEFFDVADGHVMLHTLMASSGAIYSRRPGRITVWISQHLGTAEPHSYLAGTTYLDQPLYANEPGAGVLLASSSQRRGHRLSHEVGHIVGFHHAAGEPVEYTYRHAKCPPESREIAWRMISGPSCEVNIMGGWYDGQYCCPGDSGAQSFLSVQSRLLKREIVTATGNQSSSSCLPNPMTEMGFQEAYCCGDGCTHKCAGQKPPMTFATAEHGTMLGRIFDCWQHLRGTPPVSTDLPVLFSSSTNWPQSAVECSDFDNGPGPCVEGR